MSWTDDIQEKIFRRVPDLQNDEELCQDLIDDAFRSIVSYSHANSYNTDWDGVLVRCVAMLYNNIGTEGSLSRSSLSTRDTFDNTDIIASFIQANIPQYLRPAGYKYATTRFDKPN